MQAPKPAPSANTLASSQNSTSGGSTRFAMVVVTSLFFMWGFITVLNDILVPDLKSIFDMNYTEVMLIQFAFFSAYFIFSIPSAKLIDSIGYKRTMVVGLLTMGAGALLFIPAASVPSYPLFLTALMILAAGITALQVAANPYVAVLGPPRTASSRLNLTQAFNSLGTTIGPYLGGLFILSAAPQSMEVVRRMGASALQSYRVHEAASVKVPYLIIGLVLILLAGAIALCNLPAMPEAERHSATASSRSVLKYRHLVLGAVAIFVYVGAEVSIGSFLVNYFSQPDIGNFTEQTAARFVSLYWGGAMLGRFIGSALLNSIRTIHAALYLAISAVVLILSYSLPGHPVVDSSPHLAAFLSGLAAFLVFVRPLVEFCVGVFVILLVASAAKGGRVSVGTGQLLGLCGLCAAALVCTSMLTTGQFAMWSIIFVGLFNSIMFPSIFTLGIAKLGPLTGDGSGVLVMAIVGGAILPVVQGSLADHLGVHHAFILPVLCYIYIVYYALKGSKPVEPA
jgi:MFS transporter, FHS family, L-fucose permease